MPKGLTLAIYIMLTYKRFNINFTFLGGDMKKILSLCLIVLLNNLSLLNAKRVGSYHDIDTVEEYNDIVKNGNPSVLYYYTSGCEACKESTPGFEELSEQLQHRCNFIKLNLDKEECKPIGNLHKIEAVPTTIVKNSQAKNITTIRGSQTKEEYKKNIKTNLAKTATDSTANINTQTQVKPQAKRQVTTRKRVIRRPRTNTNNINNTRYYQRRNSY